MHSPIPVAPQCCDRTDLRMLCCHCALNSDLNRILWGRSVPSVLDRKASVNICSKYSITSALSAVSKHIHAAMNIRSSFSRNREYNGNWFGLASGFSFKPKLATFANHSIENRGGEFPSFYYNLLTNSERGWKSQMHSSDYVFTSFNILLLPNGVDTNSSCSLHCILNHFWMEAWIWLSITHHTTEFSSKLPVTK